MNLEGQAGYTILISEPDPSGIVTITFKTLNGVTTLGTITLESLKVKTFLRGFSEMIGALYPENTPDLFKSRTIFNQIAKSGTIQFS